MVSLKFAQSQGQVCPLCSGRARRPVKSHHRPQVEYWLCQDCDLISLGPQFLLSAEQEKARYLQHQNSAEQPGYRAHLQPMVDLIFAHLGSQYKSLRGIDFGSGPQPILSETLKNQGCHIEAYDPYFSPMKLSAAEKFDFLVSTEVVEHFYDPAKEFTQIIELLNPRSWLFVMTHLHLGEKHFESWWYPKDVTHVSFYSVRTLEWISQKFALEICFQERNLICFRRKI